MNKIKKHIPNKKCLSNNRFGNIKIKILNMPQYTDNELTQSYIKNMKKIEAILKS